MKINRIILILIALIIGSSSTVLAIGESVFDTKNISEKEFIEEEENSNEFQKTFKVNRYNSFFDGGSDLQLDFHEASTNFTLKGYSNIVITSEIKQNSQVKLFLLFCSLKICS